MKKTSFDKILSYWRTDKGEFVHDRFMLKYTSSSISVRAFRRGSYNFHIDREEYFILARFPLQ